MEVDTAPHKNRSTIQVMTEGETRLNVLIFKTINSPREYVLSASVDRNRIVGCVLRKWYEWVSTWFNITAEDIGNGIVTLLNEETGVDDSNNIIIFDPGSYDSRTRDIDNSNRIITFSGNLQHKTILLSLAKQDAVGSLAKPGLNKYETGIERGSQPSRRLKELSMCLYQFLQTNKVSRNHRANSHCKSTRSVSFLFGLRDSRFISQERT